MDLVMRRRRFLVSGAATIGGLWILPSAGMVRGSAANERLQLAVFGTMYNAAHFLTAVHHHRATIVALCNPDRRKIQGVFDQWTEQAQTWAASDNPEQREAAPLYRRLAARDGVHVYADVRRMFADMSGAIDALVVSEVDHLHRVACAAALRAGIPVCSERPIGLTIDDARSLRALADRTGVPTTYRSPGTATGPFRRALEWIADGRIGAVREVHVWFRRGGPDHGAIPQGPQPVPEGLDWDLWLGPLAWREYHPDWMNYAHWRDTTNGGLGVFGPHTTIFPFLGLNLRALWDSAESPALIRVRAECSSVNRVSFPVWERIHWEFPSREGHPPVTLTWHHGPAYAPGTRERMHEILRRFGVTAETEADDLMRMAGSILVGTEGALVGDDHSVRVTALPRDKFDATDLATPRRIPPSRGLYVDWIDACRGAQPHILAGFDQGGPLSELLMLGNVATQFPDETILYDPVTGRIPNHPDASRELARSARDGWNG
jgi:hypothetical protein